MEYCKIKEKIPYYIGQKVKIKCHYNSNSYVGKITRIDTFKPSPYRTKSNVYYNLHIKYIYDILSNGKILYGEAVVYPQTEDRSYNHYYSLIEVINEN